MLDPFFLWKIHHFYGWSCVRFSEINEFEKPNDVKALNLMNSCATAVSDEYPDIVFSYGFDDEYRYFICLIIFLKYCFFLVEIIGNDC